MELRDWALRIFGADTLEEKLLAPPRGLKGLSDERPGDPVAWTRPSRPANLQVAPRNQRFRFPSPKSLHQKDMRVRCLHTFANHEFMALEMMAWAILAFPHAPPAFRRGLANVLIDEQRHFQLYQQRLQSLGVAFGDLPLNDHFWRSAAQIADPLDWVCTMHLTFEQANLDHAPFFAKVFEQVGDPESSRLMSAIFLDEIKHVRFGARWLKNLGPAGQPMFETFLQHCSEQDRPDRAKGMEFQKEARIQAGLGLEFIEALQCWPSEG